MADARHRPGWLLCAKLAVDSKISIWFEPCASLDTLPTRGNANSNNLHGAPLSGGSARLLVKFQGSGTSIHDHPRTSNLTRQLAHAGRDHRVRLPDGNALIRAAFCARVFPDADVPGERLGP